MAKIGFIGLGNMGLPMAQNLLKAGHAVAGCDVVKAAVDKFGAAGGATAASAAQACAGPDVVITMLPAGAQVREVYLAPDGVLAKAGPGTLLIDSSTIDVATARAVGPLGQVIEYLLPFLRLGGDAIVWKGRLESEIAGGRKAATALGGEIVRIVSTAELGVGDELPGRSLVVVRKTRPTPPRYPRTAAEARHRPW